MPIRIQGYLEAKYRLMADGLHNEGCSGAVISEVVGATALEYDKKQQATKGTNRCC